MASRAAASRAGRTVVTAKSTRARGDVGGSDRRRSAAPDELGPGWRRPAPGHRRPRRPDGAAAWLRGRSGPAAEPGHEARQDGAADPGDGSVEQPRARGRTTSSVAPRITPATSAPNWVHERKRHGTPPDRSMVRVGRTAVQSPTAGYGRYSTPFADGRPFAAGSAVPIRSPVGGHAPAGARSPRARRRGGSAASGRRRSRCPTWTATAPTARKSSTSASSVTPPMATTGIVTTWTAS